jgi:hypothetical protein
MASLADADLLLRVDDTDNLHSRGTGFRCQQLLSDLQLALAPHWAPPITNFSSIPASLTHPATAACITGCTASLARAEDLAAAAEHFLEQHSAPGSDPGLALSRAATGLA